jgi:mannitol-1-phosphate/altronate dehydrogenase
MVALNETSLPDLPSRIGRPTYDRRAVRAGIAHLSVGNFHRAHQAAYVDRCLGLPGHEGWGICGVGIVDSPAERAKAEALARQDGLYTLTIFPPRQEPSSAVVGSLIDYLFAPSDPAVALARLADPAVKIVSMTITEGGYNMDESTGAFRLDAPAIAHDLAHPETPSTAFGLIVGALARRRARDAGPFTVLSCDNLRHNGAVAQRAVLAFAEAREPALARWIEDQVTFPSCMVDRITPAVSTADVARLNELTGVDDEAPVFAEDFIQWVVEDRFCAGRPDLESAGVQFTADVAPYEQVKLRMLNAAHVTLAYPGQLGGYRFVHEAMADARILRHLRAFLDQDVIPLLEAPPGMPLDRYRDIVLERFANPAINDQLARLSSDSASKIPVFLGDTLRAGLEEGRDHRRLAYTLAAFARYLGGTDDKGARFEPQEPHLSQPELELASNGDPAAPLRIGTLQGLGLERSRGFVESFVRYRAIIADRGALGALESLDDAPG